MHGSYLFTFPGANILETQYILFWTQNKHPRNTYLDLCFSYMCWHSFRILLVMLRANYIRTTLHKMFGNRKGNLRIQPEGLPPFESQRVEKLDDQSQLKIRLRKSKTDQEQQGRWIFPSQRSADALKLWINKAKLINKHIK